MSTNVEKAYRLAAERYQESGVDTEVAMARLNSVPISLHCWQGDDVRGFEQAGGELAGASRPPATTRARRARRTNCVPTPARRSR